MHVPNPLGGYPLVLRDSSIDNYRNGELLADYTNNKIYYVDRKTGIPSDISKVIYDKIIESKLQNNKILITKDSESVSGDEPVIPSSDSRTFNAWYMNIYKRTTSTE